MNLTPPDILSPRALEVWCHVTDTTTHLRPEHCDTLVAYCEAVQRHEDAIVRLRELPSPIAVGSQGQPVLAPEVRLVETSANLIRQLARSLRITPEVQQIAEVDSAQRALDEFRERRERELGIA
jgi:phage terminase small subunit